MHRKPHWGSALAAIAVASLSVVNSLAEDKFRIANVGTLPGGSVSYSYAVNDSAQIAGYSGIPGNFFHAFRSSSGSMLDLSVLPGDSLSLGYGINSQGNVVGYSSGSAKHAAYFDGTNVVDLGAFPDGLTSEGWAINDSNQVAGFGTREGRDHAFLYTNGALHDLGTLPGGGLSRAYGINNAGHIVGWSQTSGNNRAFIYDGSTLQAIGPSTGLTNTDTYGFGINANNVVAGYMTPSGGAQRAFIYDGTQTINLGVLPGATYSNVDAGGCINDLNMVVGISGFRAFLYANGTMQDLDLLKDNANWHLDDAHGINNLGQVVGKGVLVGVGERGYIATPELHWKSSTDGDWSTGANWSWGIAPGAPHPVYVEKTSTGSLVVNGPTAGTTVAEINVGVSGSGSAELKLRHTGTLTLTPGLSGNGKITVGSKGTLSGAGDIQGDVIVQPGGRLAPGESSGHFSITGSLTLQSNVTDAANLDLDLDGNPQTSMMSFDLITVTGSGSSFSAGGANLNITPHQAVVLNQPYVIVRATNNATINSTRFGNLSNNGTTFVSGLMTYTVSYGQTEISVTFSSLHLDSVPEPASLMGISVLALAMRRRRR